MYTYKNSFHNTEFQSNKSPELIAIIGYRIAGGKATNAEKSFQRRMRSALCGIKGCKCGDDFGRRD